jgi:hypothetical protein
LCPIFLFKGEADYHVPEQAVVKLSDCMVERSEFELSVPFLEILRSNHRNGPRLRFIRMFGGTGDALPGYRPEA